MQPAGQTAANEVSKPITTVFTEYQNNMIFIVYWVFSSCFMLPSSELLISTKRCKSVYFNLMFNLVLDFIDMKMR